MKGLAYTLFCSSLLLGCGPYEWGHHFSFTNLIGLEIDSLSVVIGEDTTMVYNSEYGMSENLAVPEIGYPHQVKIKLFAKERTVDLLADSFDYYNCDGTHEYILRKYSAEYLFHN